MAPTLPPAPRAVQLGIHLDLAGHINAVSKGLGDAGSEAEVAPLGVWAARGWRLASSPHGNLDRGAVIVLQKGRLLNVAQAIIGIEQRGKKLKVVCRETFGIAEPAEWKDLQAWADDGWVVIDSTGNLAHGAWLTLRRQDKSDDEGDGAKASAEPNAS